MATTVSELVHGWDDQAYAIAETTFGTLLDATAASAFEFETLEMGEVEAPEFRYAKHKTGGRSPAQVIQGKTNPIPFTMRGPVMPSGVAGTEPDMAAWFKNAFGGQTDTGSTKNEFEFTDKPATGLSVTRVDGDGNLAQYGYGGIVKSLRIEGGEGEVEVEFSGEFVGKSTAGAMTTNQGSQVNSTDSSTVITLATGDVYRLVGTGQILMDPADGIEEMLVTAVSYSSGTVTVTRGHNSTAKQTHEDGFDLRAFVPAQTLEAAAAPIGEQEGTYTLHGITIYPQSYSFEINTGREFRGFEKGSVRRRNVIAKRATVTGSVTLVADREMLEFLGRANQFTSSTLAFVEGDTGGLKFQIDAGVVRCKIPKVDIPDDDVAVIEVGLELHDWDNDDSPIRCVFL